MNKSTTTMSAPGSSRERKKAYLRLTAMRLETAITKLGNERSYTLASIRNSLHRDLGKNKYTDGQVKSALQRAIKAGRVKVMEDRFSLPHRISQPASRTSSKAASQASTSRESKGRSSGSSTATSKLRNRPGFVLRKRFVLPTNPSPGHAALMKIRRRRRRQQQQQSQFKRWRCKRKEAVAACDDSRANDDQDDRDVGAGGDDSEAASGADGMGQCGGQQEAPSDIDDSIVQPVADLMPFLPLDEGQ